MWIRTLTLFRKVKVEQRIKEMTHKFNVKSFWLRCDFYLICVIAFDSMWTIPRTPFHDLTMISKLMVQLKGSTPYIESLPTK